MEELNNLMGSVNTQWDTLKSSLEQKFSFCRKIHDQHNLEVENYEEFGDLFDQKKFKNRVERSISKLQSEQALQKMSLQQLQSEKEKLMIYKKRLASDLIELKTENAELKEQRMEENYGGAESRGSVSAQNERDDSNEVNSQLRESISKMKTRMQKLETMSINVAADPAKAIQQIADPILKLIETKTDHQEKVLQDMQMERLRKQKRILELKEQIFNEKFEHINLRRTIEEQEVEKVNVQEDTVFVQKQLQEQTERKRLLRDELTSKTKLFSSQHARIKEELDQTNGEIAAFFRGKEEAQSGAEELAGQRGGSLSSKKYYKYVTDHLEQIRECFEKLNSTRNKLENIRGTFALKSEEALFENGYRIGAQSRVAVQDRDKRNALIADLNAKDSFLIEQLKQKESKERELACYGNIHFIHKTFDQVKGSLRTDIKRYKRDRHRIKEFLDQMVDIFQSGCLYSDKTQYKKNKANLTALQFLSQQYDIKLSLQQ